MLPSNLRNKFFQVQEEITSSLRNFVLSEPVSHSSTSSKSNRNLEGIRVDAGADLLNHYQFQWCRIREAADQNYKLAEQVDKAIELLSNYVNYQQSLANMLTSGLTSLPAMIAQLDKIASNMDKTGVMLSETEENLQVLDDLLKERNLRLQMEEYTNKVKLLEHEKKMELEKLKNQLADEHNRKISEYENALALKAKERQAIFEEAFEKELEQYKRSGSIPKISLPPNRQTVSLEEVVVEDDPSALDEFLGDV